MAPPRWFLKLSGRSLDDASLVNSKRKKRRKLPGFKAFGRSASTTQLVALGASSELSSSADGDADADASAAAADEEWRIEAAAPPPVPPPPQPLPLPSPSTASKISLSMPSPLAVAKGWYLATHCALALFPFPAIFLSDRGLSSVEIGTIMALRPFISAVAGACLCFCVFQREREGIGDRG